MRSNTGSPGFMGKTNGLCQSPSFLDQEDRGFWVRDCILLDVKLFFTEGNKFGIRIRQCTPFLLYYNTYVQFTANEEEFDI